VIVPTYNRAHLVCQAIDSLLAQTYHDFEIIVVDDGSADNTREALSRYGERIHYIFQQNAGLSAARNTGIRASKGELLAFLDDDDTMSPTKLEVQVAYLNTHPDVGVVYCGYQVVDADNQLVQKEVRPTLEGNILKELLLELYLFPPVATLTRRDCLDRVGLFDEVLQSCQDDDLWYRIAMAGYRFGCIEQPLCQYRNSRDSLGKDIAKLEHDVTIILQRVFNNPELPMDIVTLRDEVYARRYLDFGLNYYGRSHAETDAQMESARRYVSEALALKPTVLENRPEFYDLVTHRAIELEPGDPEAHVRRVMSTLFSAADKRARLESRLLARLHVILAFRGYTANHRSQVVRHVLAGLQHDPTWLRNRGLISIFLRALLGVPFRRNERPVPLA
jgi:glycosyltransferase involved in cell wall biosynthesis